MDSRRFSLKLAAVSVIVMTFISNQKTLTGLV